MKILYRPNVGVCLLNAEGLVFVGERIDSPGGWQMPQGGIDLDVDLETAALRELKEEIEGVPSPATIRRVRKKLRLSQRDAGGILKVGESAFDKYERGLVEPSGPTSQLLRLLDRHPELVDELRNPAR